MAEGRKQGEVEFDTSDVDRWIGVPLGGSRARWPLMGTDGRQCRDHLILAGTHLAQAEQHHGRRHHEGHREQAN